MRGSPDQDSFESFYKSVRTPLLLQTYALTGDLAASQRAVRDALIVAWHHWRKVRVLDDPEGWVRPLAWARAQRRHTGRWWVRQKGIEPEVRETLDALDRLTAAQRKVLLLTHLTVLPLDQLAREASMTRAAAERELQAATAQFAIHRDVPSTSVRTMLDALTAVVSTVRWPRTTIVCRAGSARRRSHTALGAAAAVAAVVIAGSLVTDATGVRPDLGAKGVLHGTAPAPGSGPRASAPPPPDPLTAAALLSDEQVADVVPGSWRQGATTRNIQGDGLVFPCQRSRYADPRGVGALVRTFSPDKAGANRSVMVGQAAEASRDEGAGKRTYDTALGWYAGCGQERVQLLSTRRVSGVGDSAMLLVLRDWTAPVSTMVVGVARTGAVTTTTVSSEPGKGKPRIEAAGTLLATAVNGLCSLPDAGPCASGHASQEVAPLAVGTAPAMLGEVDLPPVRKVSKPWVGTEPSAADDNLAATRCEKADFSGFSDDTTRSFVIPTAKDLPPQFGITETVGGLKRGKARSFVSDVRDRLAGCPDKDLGTRVTRLQNRATDEDDLTVWRLRVEISDNRSVRFLMAVMRSGTSVAQLTFLPAGDVQMATGAFAALAERALVRLQRLPAPHR